jgi:hypothetical protein
MEHQVAPRQMKMPAKENAETEMVEVLSQRKRPEPERYFLQVDRQTKASFKTAEAAHSAGLEIKTRYPVVKVTIYDSIDGLHTLVEPPATSS